jgi:hypothetical protein
MVVACKSATRWFDLDAVRTTAKTDVSGWTPQASGKREYDRTGEIANHERVVISNPAGAPPLDWWQISPGGYSGAHYAVFPPELVVKPIEAMCPRRVCRTCNTPSRRLVDAVRTVDGEPLDKWLGNRPPPQRRAGWGGLSEADHEERFDNLHINHNRLGTERTVTGWSTCGCPGSDGIRMDGYHTGTGWRPGIVLDPFAGSGTTLSVAVGHSRDAIGIDLDRRNVDFARNRIGMWFQEVSPVELSEMIQ